MALPTPKELKQLAAACRAAGIKSFKGEGIEFTLSDSEPPTPKPRGRAAKAKMPQAESTIDTKEATPTEDELLYWSAGGGVPIPMNPDGNN